MAHSMRRVVSQANKGPGWVAAVMADGRARRSLRGGRQRGDRVHHGTTPAPFCAGGYVRTVPGDSAGTSKETCEGLCSPSLCANPGNVCVANLCQLQCATLLDCPFGQDCVAVTTDGPDGGAGGTMTTICQNDGKAAIGAACPFGNECKPASPPVAGGAQPACPDGSNCDYTQCGGDTCSPDPIACGGVSGACSIGLCDDGSACTVPGCTADKCKALVCLSDAPAGGADEAAYCTLQDCHGDTDCPGGFWCAKVHDPHKICGQPAPSASCGTTTDPCVDPTMDMANGTTYAQGPWCTQRTECRIRRACDPCATDLDCSGTAGRHCTTLGSAKFCLEDCKTDSGLRERLRVHHGRVHRPRGGACTGAGQVLRELPRRHRVRGGPAVPPVRDGRRARVREHLHHLHHRQRLPGGAALGAPRVLRGRVLSRHLPHPDEHGLRRALTCWPSNKGAGCYLSSECFSKHCIGADAADQVPGNCQ